MESRKRSRAEDSDHISAKKRVISDSRDSPIPVNGAAHESDEPKDGDDLEMFRKDAIYRRMRYYSRESERNQARIAELEQRRNTCEAGLAALEACWIQLLNTIRSLVKPEEVAQVEVAARDIYDLTAHVSESSDSQYVEKLRTRMQETEQLVVAFVQLSKQGGSKLTREDTFKKCQEAQTECASLRAEVSRLHTQLRDTSKQKEKYHDRLVVAEKRIDRLQSKTLAAINPHQKSEKEEVNHDSPMESPASPTPPQPTPPNGTATTDSGEWEVVAAKREAHIQRLLDENKQLQEDVLNWKLAAQSPSEQLVTESLWYKALLKHASVWEKTVLDSQAQISALREQQQKLQTTVYNLEQSARDAEEKALQELKTALNKRDNENLRLREQRDQLNTELSEHRARASGRGQAFSECKVLLEARTERMKVLELETSRLKAQMAAQSGDRDLMNFFFRATDEEASYIEDLKQRLAAAEERIDGLTKNPNSSERSIREQFAASQRELQKYRDLVGGILRERENRLREGEKAPTGPVEVQELVEQLHRKQKTIEQQKTVDMAREKAEGELYQELEKLSTAWETLDKQVKSKVFDLAAMEDKISKNNLEKMKAENKFYAAMRDKEATDAERKALARSFEKQGQVVERLMETEKTLLARVGELEKEVMGWKQQTESMDLYAKRRERESAEWQERARGERERTAASLAMVHKTEDELRAKQEELRKLEESVLKKEKEVEKQSAKAKTLAQNHTHGSSREAELQSEVDKCMDILKCSTCKMNMRNTVITKCMHSFCRNCVNERISSRQRKCPACNLPFSQGEVQQLYFQ